MFSIEQGRLRFNQWGSYYCRGFKSEQGVWPPHFNHCALRNSRVYETFDGTMWVWPVSTITSSDLAPCLVTRGHLLADSPTVSSTPHAAHIRSSAARPFSDSERPNSSYGNTWGGACFYGCQPRPHLRGGGRGPSTSHFMGLLHTAQPNFAWWSNQMSRKFLQGRPRPRLWPKVSVTRMLTRISLW